MWAVTESVPGSDLEGCGRVHDRGDRGLASLSRERWAELFRELAEGSVRALGELYDAAAPRVYGLAVWRTGSADDAGDVVQEVFVRVAEQRQRLLKVKDPRSWLLAVAHRAAIDVVRRRRRRPAVPLEQAPLVVAPEKDSARAIDGERASAHLALLPAAQREVIFLHLYAECSFADVGRILGVSRFTAASRYRLGIGKLRRLMEVES